MSLAPHRLLLAVALLAATPALAGEITLYEGEGFSGRRMVLRDPLPNFDNTPFNDRAASLSRPRLPASPRELGRDRERQWGRLDPVRTSQRDSV